MEWEIVRFEEGTDFDPDRGFYRFKRAIFKVDGIEHSVRISMKDFEEGKAMEIIQREVEKIAEVMGKKGKIVTTHK